MGWFAIAGSITLPEGQGRTRPVQTDQSVGKEKPMTKCLLALAVAVFGGTDGEANGVGQTQVRPRWQKTGEVVLRLEGRVLGCLIQKGMTVEQVERILGTGSCTLPSVALVVGGLFGWLRCDRLGLDISLFGDSDGVLRVDGKGVTFRPLFD
jgi:hypothetical protein